MGFNGSITIIPDGGFSFVTTGNIAVPMTARVGEAISLNYDAINGKWYPLGVVKIDREIGMLFEQQTGISQTDIHSMAAVGTDLFVGTQPNGQVWKRNSNEINNIGT